MIKRVAPVVLVALAIVFAAFPAFAKEQFPRFTAPVVDAADVVPDDAEESISAQLLSYQRRSGNQIAVAVVETLGEASVEDYAEDLFDAWGVGEKDKDNGVLLLIAMEERKLRVEVGYGVEGDLTDLESGRIVDRMTPFMREGDVAGAIEAGTNDIRLALGDTEAVVPEEPEGEPSDSFNPLVLFFLLPFIFGGFAGRRRGRRRRDFSLWPVLLGGAWGASSGSSSGGFGGGGGGGFGGGGGGGSGGGGASGGW